MRQGFIRMALGVGVSVVLAGAPPRAQAVDCTSFIPSSAGTPLRCDFKRDDGATDSNCTFFHFNPAYPATFFLDLPDGRGHLCACDATGSFTAPKFDVGKDFLCFQDVPSINGNTAKGKVVGKKIKKGLYFDISLHTTVFECAPDPVMCP